jgi:membrane protein YqaA with SNARE-associated domain
MNPKPLEEKLDQTVEEILATNTVSRAQALMASHKGLWLVAVISFVESATPIPVVTDPFMMAAILLNRASYLRIILITSFASVLGGVAAYYTAYYFVDFLLQFFSPDAAFEIARTAANTQENTFVLTLIGAFTPVPYTFTAWAVGVLQGGIVPFIAASVLGRGGRYLIGGWLTYRFGQQAVSRAKRSIGITSIILLVLAAVFVWYKM